MLTRFRFYSRTPEITEFYNAVTRDARSEVHHSGENLKTCGKYAALVLTLLFEANSDMNLDHISFNLVRYFLK
jgi:hypothetical protein